MLIKFFYKEGQNQATAGLQQSGKEQKKAISRERAKFICPFFWTQNEQINDAL